MPETDPYRRRRVAARLAGFARRIADRVDPDGAVRLTHVTFTFEDGIGIMFRDDARGCRVAYLGTAEYERAHDEAGPPDAPALPWPAHAWLPHRAAAGWPPRGYIMPCDQPPTLTSWPANATPAAKLRAILERGGGRAAR
jgi:hypothetical protein